ncbi:uncharacterized protein LOC129950653 [Eupeodes corollae]|uniref:uncharacterized protein LOC129950653 n=1 Tax=Eupeodes corollae TaxID=290404 RepID=UPI00248F48A3|nr:uncharacterized protein LOC129950653 [Eupeodes corollae]
MKKCSILGCISHQLNRYVSLFFLVRKGVVREEWRLAIESLNGQVIDSSRPLQKFFICDLHFDKKFIKTLGTNKRLTEDAVPTLFPNMHNMKEQIKEEVQDDQVDNFDEACCRMEQMIEPPIDEVQYHPTDDLAEAPIKNEQTGNNLKGTFYIRKLFI